MAVAVVAAAGGAATAAAGAASGCCLVGAERLKGGPAPRGDVALELRAVAQGVKPSGAMSADAECSLACHAARIGVRCAVSTHL